MAPTEVEVHTAVGDWFADAWDPTISLLEWRVRLLESGRDTGAGAAPARCVTTTNVSHLFL